MQERTNAYMTVPKTKVYLYHLYLAFSSAKILTVFQKLSLKIIKQTQMQKTHTIPFVCFTFSFQTLFYSFFFSKPLWQDTFLKHKRNPCTVNNLQLVFFFLDTSNVSFTSHPVSGLQHSTLRTAKHLNVLVGTITYVI